MENAVAGGSSDHALHVLSRLSWCRIFLVEQPTRTVVARVLSRSPDVQGFCRLNFSKLKKNEGI